MPEPTRPDPDALLAQVQQEEARAHRGSLKIFFGASAGVGKTYAMLAAARVAHAQGTPVIIGVVESHGRPETEALARDLPRLPLQSVPYRGHQLHEFDLDAQITPSREIADAAVDLAELRGRAGRCGDLAGGAPAVVRRQAAEIDRRIACDAARGGDGRVVRADGRTGRVRRADRVAQRLAGRVVRQRRARRQACVALGREVRLEDLALKGLRNLLGFSTTLRKAAGKALLSSAKPEEAVDEGWKLLSTDRPERFNEMEFHLPAENQLKALKEVIETIERERPDVFFPIEARRIAPDEAWLSPFQGGPHGSIAVHCHYRDEFAFLFELIQPILLRYGGRPHWGKLHNLQGRALEALYPKWNDFRALRQQLDPEGRMLNLYLKGLFNV